MGMAEIGEPALSSSFDWKLNISESSIIMAKTSSSSQ